MGFAIEPLQLEGDGQQQTPVEACNEPGFDTRRCARYRPADDLGLAATIPYVRFLALLDRCNGADHGQTLRHRLEDGFPGLRAAAGHCGHHPVDRPAFLIRSVLFTVFENSGERFVTQRSE